MESPRLAGIVDRIRRLLIYIPHWHYFVPCDQLFLCNLLSLRRFFLVSSVLFVIRLRVLENAIDMPVVIDDVRL